MSANKISKPFIKKYLETILKIENKHALAHFSGGVGDANHFSRDGIIVMDGLGPMGDDMHTPEEYIDLPTVSTRSKILTEFLLGL